MIASDAVFSHTNGHTTEERFMLRLMKKKEEEDDELGVFGAEKYFKGVIDDELLRASKKSVHYHSNQPKEKQETCKVSKLKTPSSVHSESSCSRKGLLVSNDNNHSKKTSVKSLLASLCCNCNDKGSVNVTEVNQMQVKGGDLAQKTKSMSSKWANENVHIKRETSSNILDSSRNEGQNETGSDASSDLFEIESFAKNENNSFLAPQATEKTGYAPSEASVDWSVVTASMADLSTTEDLGVTRNVKGSGILSGCKSLKAVRISGDERGKTGGEKTMVSVLPARREWCHRLDSATPVAKIQASTKLIVAGSGYSHRSQNRFGIR